MWGWRTFWMILHTMGAVIAFGPMYSQPLIGLLGRRNPQHAVLAAEIAGTIASRVTLPVAITLAFTGWGLIASEGVGFLDNTWLWVSVLLYVIALAFGFAVQGPNARRMLGLLRSRPTAPATGQQGPPPEMAALVRRLNLGVVFLTLVVTAIFVLMIWQPGGVAHEYWPQPVDRGEGSSPLDPVEQGGRAARRGGQSRTSTGGRGSWLRMSKGGTAPEPGRGR